MSVTYSKRSGHRSYGYKSTKYEYCIVEPDWEGTLVSPVIDFTSFEGQLLWEKFQVQYSGTVSIQVLDEYGNVIPDSVIPGNEAGLTDNTIHLWNLSPVDYPAIRLKANLQGIDAELEEWAVFTNTGYEWTFRNDDDREGWYGMTDAGASSLHVFSGNLYSYTSENNPYIQYDFPSPVSADRFSTLEITVRTTLSGNSDVSLWWNADLQGYSSVRSFDIPDQDLSDFTTLTFDLTEDQMPLKENWEGMVDSIRLYPAVDYKAHSSSISVYIDKITLY